MHTHTHTHSDKFMDSPIESSKQGDGRRSWSVKESCEEDKEDKAMTIEHCEFLTVTRFTFDFI